jgi:phosphonate transport system substrate-binding protein
MMKKIFLVWILFQFVLPASAKEDVYYFGVINQRSITLTAQYWNPILRYVSDKSGVQLRLKMGRTAPETTAMTVRGEHAFVYTNHMFNVERDKLGFRVILRLDDPSIHSTIIVRRDSPITSLKQLQGKKVVFPSPEAFVGYWVPMDHLLKSGLKVHPVYAGNQEGAMARVQAGAVEAGGVNQQVLERYARRENFQFRSLWVSEGYLGIPIMVSPKVEKALVDRVRKAFLMMNNDPAGRRILKASAALIKKKKSLKFLPASDDDYENYRKFYRETVVRKKAKPE